LLPHYNISPIRAGYFFYHCSIPTTWYRCWISIFAANKWPNEMKGRVWYSNLLNNLGFKTRFPL
jgi:hypothetical protein